jgi:hypothetical protein
MICFIRQKKNAVQHQKPRIGLPFGDKLFTEIGLQTLEHNSLFYRSFEHLYYLYDYQ